MKPDKKTFKTSIRMIQFLKKSLQLLPLLGSKFFDSSVVVIALK